MTTKMVQPIPYISFDGNCAEAMQFYAETLGGEISHMIKYGETPMAGEMPPGSEDKIMNAELLLPGGVRMYGGDSFFPFEGFKGIGLALIYDEVDEAKSMFDRLAEGGKVGMPFAPSFWSKGFGMVTDKFGVDWMVNGEMIPV